jgi:MSHA biogenesis protein MshQ
MFTLTAQNTSNATTANYVGNGTSSSWAKLPLTTWGAAPASAGSPGFGFAASTWAPSQPAGSSLAASVTAPTATNSNTWNTGTTTVTAKHQIVRSTAPAAPTTVTVTTLPVDSDGVTATSAAAIGSPLLRFGRLRLSNAFGSEKANLQMPVQAQYWSGQSWVLSSDDGCTSLLAGNFYLLPGAPAGTSASAVTIASGAGTLTITKPSPTATGFADVAADLGSSGSDQSCLPSHGGIAASLPWLRSQNGSCATTYDRDPSARATFGIYAPETRKTVHVREQF